MDPLLAGIVGVIALAIIVMTGMPIAFALFTVGALGLFLWTGPGAMFTQITTVTFGWTFNFGLAVMPLFIFMGHVIDASGIGEELFTAVRAWLGRLPGGLASATMLANAFFGAASASSLGAVALFMKVALPEMLKNKYSPKLSSGSITTGACLAQMIPPSIVIVLLGIISGESIGQLLMAGFFPGFLTAIAYMILITAMCLRNPQLGPPAPERYSFREKIVASKGIYGVLLIAVIIIGGIYLGWFSPTEAGAVGAFTALFIALGRRKLSWRASWQGLIATGSTISMAFILVIGGVLFSRFLVISGFTTRLAQLVAGSGLPPMAFVSLAMLLYLFLGMILDPGAMLMVTVPLLWPILETLGLNPIWFGILIVKMIEIAMITPPVALVLYTAKGAAGDLVSLQDIMVGAIPFIIVNIGVLALLMFVPQIILFLPQTMRGG